MNQIINKYCIMIYHEYEVLICSYLVCVGSVRYTLLTSLSFHARPGRVEFHGGMSIDYFSVFSRDE